MEPGPAGRMLAYDAEEVGLFRLVALVFEAGLAAAGRERRQGWRVCMSEHAGASKEEVYQRLCRDFLGEVSQARWRPPPPGWDAASRICQKLRGKRQVADRHPKWRIATCGRADSLGESCPRRRRVGRNAQPLAPALTRRASFIESLPTPHSEADGKEQPSRSLTVGRSSTGIRRLARRLRD